MSLKTLLELKQYAGEISAIIAYVVAIASIIIKLTPTVKDDNFLLPIIKFISKYVALNRSTRDDILRKAKK